MRKLGKIKLNQFSKDELDHRKLNALKGGCVCPPCSCSNGCSDKQYGSTADASYDLNYDGTSTIFEY